MGINRKKATASELDELDKLFDQINNTHPRQLTDPTRATLGDLQKLAEGGKFSLQITRRDGTSLRVPLNQDFLNQVAENCRLLRQRDILS